MRRLNFSRPARVAKVSGKRLGDIGRPKMKRARQERKREFDIDRSWVPSNWTLSADIAHNSKTFTLNPINKTTQISIVVGDWVKLLSGKLEEILLVTKITTSKGVNTYTVNRAHHKRQYRDTEAIPFKTKQTTIYVNHE